MLFQYFFTIKTDQVLPISIEKYSDILNFKIPSEDYYLTGGQTYNIDKNINSDGCFLW